MGPISDFLAGAVYYFLSFGLVISVVVFIHEYGHYIVARICKVKVEVFSIGFGNEIFGFNDRSGTRWKLSAVPLGGYVKMLGDANEASVPSQKQELTDEEKLHSFHTKPRYKKAAVVLAGPFANIIFTVVVLTILFCMEGYYRTPPVIGNVIKGSAAEQVGLLPGDTILQINNNKIIYFEDISRIVMSNPKTEMEFEYERNNEKHKVKLTPVTIEDKDAFGNKIEREVIGINSVNVKELKQLSFLEAINSSIDGTYYAMSFTVKAIMQMVVGKRSIKEMNGPIKIVQYSGQSMKRGMTAVLYLMAMISASLATVNLLPIPLLDGGHLFQYIIEGIIRRDLSLKFQKYASILGACILLSLMAITTFNDVTQVIFNRT